MEKVVGVRFRNVGKIYYFNPKNYKVKVGDHVIVETARGVEYGRVVLEPRSVKEDEVVHPLKEVLRVATKEDEDHEAENRQKEKEAFKICKKKIREHGLDMKLIDAEYTFDNNKVLFYFTADGRIDFRQLVKDLASVFKTRIELRQIGVRDETKILGGIGICGRTLCCHTYLSEFAPVSIKMAKEQNLSLNPTKISGLCDRLMCCLKYEQDHYEQTRKRMPRVGREIITPDGSGVINAINVLEETVRVRIAVGDSFELREYKIDDCQRPGQDERKPRPEEDATAEDAQQAAENAEGGAAETVEPNPPKKQEQRPPRGERPERAPRPERGPKPERGPRPERGERPPRPERGPRPPKKQTDRPQDKEAPVKAEQPVVEEQKAVEAIDVLEIREDAKKEDLF